MRPTLKDIANELGLSVNTVSRALRGASDIGEATKQRVIETAARMDYRKNMAASHLRTNRSYLIGLVVTDYRNPAMSDIIAGVEAAGKDKGYTIMTASGNESADAERSAVQSLFEHGVDGLLLVPSMLNSSLLDFLCASKVPYVLIARHYSNKKCNYVCGDDELGGRKVADLLWDNGHRKFLYISGYPFISSAKERLNGFRGRLIERGAAPEDIKVFDCDGSRSGARRAIQRWLGDQPTDDMLPVTAIFCFSDYVAYGVYSALKDSGYNIPEDVSVVGYDNNELSDLIEPPLTTVENHFYEMGVQAMTRLVEMIDFDGDSKGLEVQEIISQPKIVMRDSMASLSE